MIVDHLLAGARLFAGWLAGPQPSPSPPPTDETRLEILRLRQRYDRARLLILSRERNVDQDARTLYVFVGLILLILVATLVSGQQDLPLAVVFAGIALAFGAVGTQLQSSVSHVLSDEGAAEDLARQLSLAAGALTDAEATVALAQAELILDGRLRWTMATDKGPGGDEGKARLRRISRWSRIALGVLLEGGGASIIGFYSAVGIQAIQEGLFTQALSVGVAHCVTGIAFLWLGSTVRTWDRSHSARPTRGEKAP